MPKRMSDPEKRRSQILTAAQDLFFQKGYYSVNVDDIAKAAGVVRGTVLHYFGSREKLFQAVLNQSGDVFLPKLDAVIGAEGVPAIEKIKSLLQLCEKQFSGLKAVVNDYEKSGWDGRYNFDSMRLMTYYRLAERFAAVLVQGNDEGTIHIENPNARAESIIFAILGITGADLTSEEIIQEMYQVVEMLLCIKCG